MKLKTKLKNGDLRVWWKPQIPMNGSFEVDVATPQEALKLINILADYDIFQNENNIKPDYSNAGGLSVFKDGEWCDWQDDNGDDIDSSELIGE
jgi:hypothetical protein